MKNSIRTADEFSTKLLVTELNIAPQRGADSNLHRYKNTQEYIIQKEYRIGKSLEKFTGFIRYICLFGCFDDTNNKLEQKNTSETTVAITTKICNATKIENNWKYVLVMPYIQEGSIENNEWCKENLLLLKNVIIHTVLSIANAFEKVGFVHQDLHLGNVLIKKTKIQSISYVILGNEISVDTMGYKIVIMDFEKALLNQTDTFRFWDDLNIFLRNIDGLRNKNNEAIDWNYSSIITQFIKNMRKNRTSVGNILELIQMIEYSQLELIEIQPALQYEPIVF